jgi:hypothetical protein
MRRSSACFGLLFVMLGWCIDDPLQQRVSYDKPGQTLKSLLRDLSAQTNLKLYAAPPLDTEIVLVAVQDMPLQTLMEHIAYVVDGEWIAEKRASVSAGAHAEGYQGAHAARPRAGAC